MQAFRTREYFYTYRRWKGGWLCYAQKANSSLEDTENVDWVEGSFPLLLHLKDGKYFIRGKSCTYNVDLTGKECRVTISPAPLDGFREVTESDLMAPRAKLRYSLSRKEFGFVLVTLGLLAVALIGVCFLLAVKTHRLSREIEREAARRKVVFMSRIKRKSVPLFWIIREIESVARAVKGVAYIKKVCLNSRGTLSFTIECTNGQCFVPLKGAERVDKNTYRVIVTYTGEKK